MTRAGLAWIVVLSGSLGCSSSSATGGGGGGQQDAGAEGRAPDAAGTDGGGNDAQAPGDAAGQDGASTDGHASDVESKDSGGEASVPGGPCGPSLTCTPGQVCVDARHEGADGGPPTLYSCADYPAACGAVPTCACEGSLCPGGYQCLYASTQTMQCY